MTGRQATRRHLMTLWIITGGVRGLQNDHIEQVADHPQIAGFGFVAQRDGGLDDLPGNALTRLPVI